jgi:beta subunit of N-acylethanolamine-hydrolyzing acid amidase
MAPKKAAPKDPKEDAIPTYRIDLSLPPAERYRQLAKDLGPRMRALKPLFDEVLMPLLPYAFMRRTAEVLASVFLRRVYSAEETQELRGISSASGVDMYFLVALNVLLDSLLGCTSGGVMTRPSSRKGERVGCTRGDRMMHFRTLDWGMDGLRSVIVTLEFIRSKSAEPGKVIARSITYAGFVGCLTGVR